MNNIGKMTNFGSGLVATHIGNDSVKLIKTRSPRYTQIQIIVGNTDVDF